MRRGASGSNAGWEGMAGQMTTRRLTLPIRLLIPSLLVASLPKRAIGFSYEGGRSGAVVGSLVLVVSLVLGALLYGVAGVLGALAPVWLLGTTGAAMLANSRRPIAFVKPLCQGCRLLPVIKEHEAIHLSGVESDGEVWESMRQRYSCESLALAGDPAICAFCPIPKRLKEH
ncbi:MAG: hypothetical protein JRN24_02060 [Nitrososphaerota archaeon]|nr:hypothetical protein [Nitrososphaerota archaeon]